MTLDDVNRARAQYERGEITREQLEAIVNAYLFPGESTTSRTSQTTRRPTGQTTRTTRRPTGTVTLDDVNRARAQYERGEITREQLEAIVNAYLFPGESTTSRTSQTTRRPTGQTTRTTRRPEETKPIEFEPIPVKTQKTVSEETSNTLVGEVTPLLSLLDGDSPELSEEEKGQILTVFGEIDQATTDAEKQYDDLRAERHTAATDLRQVNTELSTLRERIDTQRGHVEKARQDLEDGTITQAEFDAIEGALDTMLGQERTLLSRRAALWDYLDRLIDEVSEAAAIYQELRAARDRLLEHKGSWQDSPVITDQAETPDDEPIKIKTPKTVTKEDAKGHTTTVTTLLQLLAPGAELTEEDKKLIQAGFTTIDQSTTDAEKRYSGLRDERDTAVTDLKAINTELSTLRGQIETQRGHVEKARQDLEDGTITQAEFDAIEGALDAMLQLEKGLVKRRSDHLDYLDRLIEEVTDASDIYQELLNARDRLLEHEGRWEESPILATGTVVEEESDFEESKQTATAAETTFNTANANAKEKAKPIAPIAADLSTAYADFLAKKKIYEDRLKRFEPIEGRLAELKTAYEDAQKAYETLEQALKDEGLKNELDNYTDNLIPTATMLVDKLKDEYDGFQPLIDAQTKVIDDLVTERDDLWKLYDDYIKNEDIPMPPALAAMVTEYRDKRIPHITAQWNKFNTLDGQTNDAQKAYEDAAPGVDALKAEYDAFKEPVAVQEKAYQDLSGPLTAEYESINETAKARDAEFNAIDETIKARDAEFNTLNADVKAYNNGAREHTYEELDARRKAYNNNADYNALPARVKAYNDNADYNALPGRVEAYNKAKDAADKAWDDLDKLYKQRDAKWTEYETAWNDRDALYKTYEGLFNRRKRMYTHNRRLEKDADDLYKDIKAEETKWSESIGGQAKTLYDNYKAKHDEVVAADEVRKGLYNDRDAKYTEYETAWNDRDRLYKEYGPKRITYNARVSDANHAYGLYRKASQNYNVYWDFSQRQRHQLLTAPRQAYNQSYEALVGLQQDLAFAKVDYQTAANAATDAYADYLGAFNNQRREWRQYINAESSHTRGLPRGLEFSDATEVSDYSQAPQYWRRGSRVDTDATVHLLADGKQFNVNLYQGHRRVSGTMGRTDTVTVVGFDQAGTAYYREPSGRLMPITQYTKETRRGQRVLDVVGWSDTGGMITAAPKQRVRQSATRHSADGTRTTLEDGKLTITDKDGNVIKTVDNWHGSIEDYDRHLAAVAAGEVYKQGQALIAQLKSMGIDWEDIQKTLVPPDPADTEKWGWREWYQHKTNPQTISALNVDILQDKIDERQAELDAIAAQQAEAQRQQENAANLAILKAHLTPQDVAQYAMLTGDGTGMPTDDLLYMTELDQYESALVGKATQLVRNNPSLINVYATKTHTHGPGGPAELSPPQTQQEMENEAIQNIADLGPATVNYLENEQELLNYISSADRTRIEAITNPQERATELAKAVDAQNKLKLDEANRLNTAIEEQNTLGLDDSELVGLDLGKGPSNTYTVAKQVKFINDMQRHGLGDLAVSVLATNDPVTVNKYETWIAGQDRLALAISEQERLGIDDNENLGNVLGDRSRPELVAAGVRLIETLREMGVEDPLAVVAHMDPRLFDAYNQQLRFGIDDNENLGNVLGDRSNPELVAAAINVLTNLRERGAQDPLAALTQLTPPQILTLSAAFDQERLGIDVSENIGSELGDRSDPEEVKKLTIWLKDKQLVGLGAEALEVLSLEGPVQQQAINSLNVKHRQMLTAAFDADDLADAVELEANSMGLTDSVIIDGKVYFLTPEQKQEYDDMSPDDRAQLSLHLNPASGARQLDFGTPYDEVQNIVVTDRQEYNDLQSQLKRLQRTPGWNDLSPADQAQLEKYFQPDVSDERRETALSGAGLLDDFRSIEDPAQPTLSIAETIDQDNYFDRIDSDPAFRNSELARLSDANSRMESEAAASGGWGFALNLPPEHAANKQLYDDIRRATDGPNWFQDDFSSNWLQLARDSYTNVDLGAPFVNLWQAINYGQQLQLYGQHGIGEMPSTPDWASVYQTDFDDAYFPFSWATTPADLGPAGLGVMGIDYSRDGFTPQELAILAGMGALEVGAAGLLLKTPRGIIKVSDLVQAGAGKRIADIGLYYGSNPIPLRASNYVPRLNWNFSWRPALPDFSLAGRGRTNPLGAHRVNTADFGELVTPGGTYGDIDPAFLPDADTNPFYGGTIDQPGTVLPPHDTARVTLDTLNTEWMTTGQPVRLELPFSDGSTKIVTYNPSPTGKVLGELTGSGPQMSGSPSAGLIVGDPDNPLSALGDIGAPVAISPSLQDMTIVGRSGIVYEMPVPIKEHPVRRPRGGWEMQPLPKREQAGYAGGGTAFEKYTLQPAYDVGSPSGAPGVVMLDPNLQNVKVSPAATTRTTGNLSRPKSTIEYESATLAGDTWRAPRHIPADEVAAIRKRADDLHPNDPVAAAKAADDEIALREGGPAEISGRDVDAPDYTSPPGDRRPSASVMVYRRDPDDPSKVQVLLTKSAYGGRRRRGKWQSPGGLVDSGETPWQSASREAYEETGARGRYVGEIHDNQALNHNFYLMEYTGGNVRTGSGAGSHGELLDRRWVDLDDVLGYDLAFWANEEDALWALREYLRTGRLPPALVTPGRQMVATPIGRVTNPFSDIPAMSQPDVQTIPLGIGTRAKTTAGIRSPLLYNITGQTLTPAQIRRINRAAFRQWIRDPFGNWRLPAFDSDVAQTLAEKGRRGLTRDQRQRYRQTLRTIRERQRYGTIGYPGDTLEGATRPRTQPRTQQPQAARAQTPQTDSDILRGLRQDPVRLRRHRGGGAGIEIRGRITPPEAIALRQILRRRARAERRRDNDMDRQRLRRLEELERPARTPGRAPNRQPQRLQRIERPAARPVERPQRLDRIEQPAQRPRQLQRIERPVQPSTGRTTQPSTGRTTQPSTGRTTQPSTGRTTQPSTGRTTQPSTGVPPVTRTTGVPPVTRTTGVPPVTRTTGVPPVTRTTGVPPVTRTTGVPPVTRTTGVPPVTRTTGVPPVTRTTGVPPVTRTTGVPPVTRTTGVPPVTRTTGVPPVTTTTGVPPVTRTTGVPPVTRTTGVPPVTRTTGVPPVTTTTRVPPVTTTRVPTIITTRPPVPPPVRFQLPNGLRLRRGEYPREVEWIHGELRFTQDLLSGQRSVEFTEAPHYGKPHETFRVIATSETVPNEQRIDLGDTDVHISQQGITFRPSAGPNEYRERRREDRRLMGRQRVGRQRVGSF